MPLEITEVFSMAPLSGRAQSTEYVVPVGFNMGVGHVLRSQQQLLAKFEDLASEYNTYSEAEGKAAFFGQDMFKETLDESKSNIRGIRDAAVSLMKAIYSEGHEPLPPEKRLDRNIATILEDRLMASAARSNDHAESGSTVETMGVTNASSSANAVARALPLSTKFLINCRDDRLSWKLKPAAMPAQRVEEPKMADASYRMVSRGAAARARSDAAWNERVRARRARRDRALSEDYERDDVVMIARAGDLSSAQTP